MGMHDESELNTHLFHMVHDNAHNFEISSTLITVILCGKLLESFSKKQTVNKLQELASLKVTKAELLEGESEDFTLASQGKEIDLELIEVGDFVRVTNGSTVPIDGKV